jgi:hypothetical protein
VKITSQKQQPDSEGLGGILLSGFNFPLSNSFNSAKLRFAWRRIPHASPHVNAGQLKGKN